MSAGKNPYSVWVQLEQPRLGTQVTFASDEFFAAKERLIDPNEPVFIEGKYDENGKWMDGWESRRKRVPGHDYCIIRLGIPGVLRGIDIDTSHFTGNFPPEASIEACVSDDDVPAGGWTEIVPTMTLSGNSHHFVDITDNSVWTHIRFNIYPDGGVARLRLYGEVTPDFGTIAGTIDLAAVENGGRAIACSDEHFGSMHNLNVAGRGINMGDGWETARRRGPGNDWVIMSLGHPGKIERVEIDTVHFKGNYPDRASLEAALFESDADATHDSDAWQALMPESKLEMNAQHFFDVELNDIGPVSHVRLSIYPDGGISRLRLHGRIEPGLSK